MMDIEQWVWKLDLPKMICFNEENGVIVKIERFGNVIKGRIKDFSMDFFREISGVGNGPQVMKQIVTAAEKEFLKAIL